LWKDYSRILNIFNALPPLLRIAVCKKTFLPLAEILYLNASGQRFYRLNRTDFYFEPHGLLFLNRRWGFFKPQMAQITQILLLF